MWNKQKRFWGMQYYVLFLCFGSSFPSLLSAPFKVTWRLKQNRILQLSVAGRKMSCVCCLSLECACISLCSSISGSWGLFPSTSQKANNIFCETIVRILHSAFSGKNRTQIAVVQTLKPVGDGAEWHKLNS